MAYLRPGKNNCLKELIDFCQNGEKKTAWEETVLPEPFSFRFYKEAFKIDNTSSLFNVLKRPNSPFAIALSAMRSSFSSVMP